MEAGVSKLSPLQDPFELVSTPTEGPSRFAQPSATFRGMLDGCPGIFGSKGPEARLQAPAFSYHSRQGKGPNVGGQPNKPLALATYRPLPWNHHHQRSPSLGLPTLMTNRFQGTQAVNRFVLPHTRYDTHAWPLFKTCFC